MIFHFKDDIYELGAEHNEMRRWLNTNVGSEYDARTWCFVRARGSFSEVPPYDRIIFTNLEDAAVFKLRFSNMIWKSEG